MKVITPMQLPLYLRSIFNISFFGFSLTLFPVVVCAQIPDIDIKSGISFYNNVDDSGKTSEQLVSSVVLGAKVPFSGPWSVSLDGFIGNESYFGTTLDYTAKVSDDFNLFGRAGFDIADEETIPKIGIGMEAKINHNLGFTMGTTIRDTKRFADYQFIAGFEYSLGKNAPEIIEPIQKVSHNIDVDDGQQPKELAQREASPEKVVVHKNGYKVKKGDTFWGIAREHKLDPKELINRNQNNIENPDLIYPGDVIIL
ncbi:LysM peptidoglycan-binding domain-containing protein [Vibrio campbellii]|uniref:LysM peptidoglycan-binding domain-containing protein n=1 Tax=Vibrio campbellii TaxID=680 RepID=UPI0005EFCE2C|nr:LysM peptidoglycan-binding domain-containing protein [Vibrio campbellii]